MRKARPPVLVLILAILQLLVGGVLLACGVFGLVASTGGDSTATVTITQGGKQTTRVYNTNEEMQKQAPSYKAYFFGSGVVVILLNFLMIAAAAGLLLQRVWGWLLTLAWALFRLGYQLATLAYLWFVAMPAANRVVQTVPRDDNHVCGSLANGNTFYHLFWMVFSLVFTFYPLLILVLLALPPIWRTFFRRRADEQAPADS